MPEAAVNLSFGTSGTVAEVKVEVGDQVKQGAVLATLDTTDLQYKVTQAEQAYRLQQLTYSETMQADTSDIAVAQASYNSALASYNAARQDYSNLADKEAVQCSSLTSAKATLDRAQTAYDRIANDHQASQYLNGDWGPFQQVVDGLENAQSAYDQAAANCRITKLSLNDSSCDRRRRRCKMPRPIWISCFHRASKLRFRPPPHWSRRACRWNRPSAIWPRRTLTAPFDGLVTAVTLVEGASGGSERRSRWPTSANCTSMCWWTKPRSPTCKWGSRREVTLDALTGITLTGTVDNIDPSGTVSNGVVNYSVRVNLDPSDAALKLDMTANASLIGEKARECAGGADHGDSQRSRHESRQRAERRRRHHQRPRATWSWCVKDGQPRPVQVTLGMTAGDLTEVSGDLQAGDEVLIVTTTPARTTRQQDFGPPDGGMGGPPPDGGGRPAGGPPPGGSARRCEAQMHSATDLHDLLDR